MNFTAFDIETMPENAGISCIAAETTTGDKEIWCGVPGKAMSQTLVRIAIKWLAQHRPLATWNGTNFDFQILAQFSGWSRVCAQLAIDAYDPMLQFLTTQGFPVGLNAVAVGFGLPGKTEGVDGLKAQQLWVGAQRDDCDLVLEYVKQDVRTTIEVVQRIAGSKDGFVKWCTKKGWVKGVRIGQLCTVRECLELPTFEPVWIHDLTRESLTSWVLKELGDAHQD